MRRYIKPLHHGFEQVTEVLNEPFKGNQLRVGYRYETEYGSWVRFVVVPRTPGLTLKECRRLAARYLELETGHSTYPGGPFSHRGHMRVGRTRVLFTQRGGYDI